MTPTHWLSFFGIAAVVVSGCASTEAPQLSREERERILDEARIDGRADGPEVDQCEQYGWYGDGSCDPKCPKPDPDCAGISEWTDCDVAPFAPEGWTRSSNASVAALGLPHHGANDVIVHGRQVATIEARFSYGASSTDLVGEEIVVMRRAGRCGAWEQHTRKTTNAQGVISFTFDTAEHEYAATLNQGQQFEFAMFVAGDGTMARAAVFVYERNRKAVFINIDGALAQGGDVPFSDVLGGAQLPPIDGAIDLVKRADAANYFIVYTTMLPRTMLGLERAWLSDHLLPKGALFGTRTFSGDSPGAEGAADFERAQVANIQTQAGFDISYAFIGAHNNACAFASNGGQSQSTYVLGASVTPVCGGASYGTVTNDYATLLQTLQFEQLPYY